MTLKCVNHEYCCFRLLEKKKSKLITASSDIHKVWTQVKGKWGEGESDQERISIVLVTSLFFEMRTRGRERRSHVFGWFEPTNFMDGPLSIDDTPTKVQRKKKLD